jgi:threonine dehydrogenase-like Zn-dependent dehydrogenase
VRALVYGGPGDIRLEERPRPQLQAPTDAIVRVTTTAVCGSDLHIYHGRVPTIAPGGILGHEFIGVIEDLGERVEGLSVGQRVVGAFSTSCGTCWYCRRALPSQCVRGQLFGFGELDGTQAEYVRVPLATHTLVPVPDAMPDEQAMFVGDIFGTGFYCVEQGGVRPGDVVAVLGCGPVGLFTQMCARLFGAAQVFAIDLIEPRLALAAKLGALAIHAGQEDPVARVRALTEGRGADVVCEAVGHESALRTAFRLVRPGGTISVVGVYVEQDVPFPLGRMFMRDITFKIGICPVRNYMERLIPLIVERRVDLAQIITHSMPLDRGPEAYAIFDAKRDNAVKIMLQP